MRARAVDHLAQCEDGRELPYLLPRANDWVPTIAGAAARAVRERLLDDNATVRLWARHLRFRRGDGAAAAVYRAVLGEPVGERTAAALLGLGETGGVGDVALVSSFVDRGRPRECRAALCALAALDGDGQVGRFVEHLDSDAPGVSRAARDALVPRASRVAPETLDALVHASPRAHAQVNALAVLSCLRRWDALPGLVRACSAARTATAGRARRYLDGWLDDYNRKFFTRPSSTQVERLKRGLADAPADVVSLVRQSLGDVLSAR